MSTLATYLYAFMIAIYPISNHAVTESSDVTEVRYHELAESTAFAVMQPYVKPLPGTTRALTGLIQLSTARFESSYVGEVVDCTKGGDGGRSWGPFQTQRAKSRTCWSTLGAAGVALEMMHESFLVTRGRPMEDRLAHYTDGPKWLTEKAAKRSRARLGLALRYWRAHPFVE